MDEALDLPYGNEFGVPIINSTGIVDLEGDFVILPGDVTVTLPKFNGYIFDSTTNTAKPVKYAGETPYTPEFLLTASSTYLLVDEDAKLFAQNTEPTEDQRADNIYLSEIIHENGIISSLVQYFDYVTEESNNVGDIVAFLDPLIRGSRLSSNGANLRLNRRAGSVLLKNAGQNNSPSALTLEAVAPLEFKYVLSDGVRSPLTNDIDPTQYEVAGVLNVVPAGEYTIQRIGMTFEQEELVQWGNTTYPTNDAAVLAFDNINANFAPERSMVSGTVFGYIIVRQSTVDLNIDAKIVPVNNFGEANNPETKTLVGDAAPGPGTLLAVNNLRDVANVQTAQANMGAGAANGLAELNAAGIVPDAQLPPDHQPYGILSRIVVNSSAYINVLYLPIVNAAFVGLNTVTLMMYVEIVDRNLDYEVREDISNTLLITGSYNVTGHQTLIVVRPAGSTVLTVLFRKPVAGGVRPVIKGLLVQFT